MRSAIYISILATLVSFSSCSASRQQAEAREALRIINTENVKKAVVNQQFVVKVNRMIPRRGGIINLVPANNFITLNNDRIRVSLAYTGRSYGGRMISGINMTGKVLNREIGTFRKGGYDIKMRVQQQNDVFVIDMKISKDGFVNLNISHPRIDNVTYNGNMSLL